MKSRNSALETAIFNISNFFVKVTPYNFFISWGVYFIHFSSPMVLKGPCVDMFVHFLHTFFWKKLL